jgi:hypothetical protein
VTYALEIVGRRARMHQRADAGSKARYNRHQIPPRRPRANGRTLSGRP